MKPWLRSALKPVGDYPDCKYMADWDALCTTQQRAFHGQSADPLTGVQLRQCNPKLFNQITRAWEKNAAFELCISGGVGGLCVKIRVPVSVWLHPSKAVHSFPIGSRSVCVISIQVKGRKTHQQVFISVCMSFCSPHVQLFETASMSAPLTPPNKALTTLSEM